MRAVREAAPGASPAEPRPRHILVWYAETAQGRAALQHAQSLAVVAGARLTVLVVVPHERTDIGCARCRQSAALWNHEMEEIANETLMAAAGALGRSPCVAYETAVGTEADAIATAAAHRHADVIVLPWLRPRRLVRGRKPCLDERLRERGPWQVVVSPPAATGGPSGPGDPPGP